MTRTFSLNAIALILTVALIGVIGPFPVRAMGAEATSTKTWSAPDPKTIPAGPMGDSIRQGRHIFMETPKYASVFVGNRQSCNDCHLQGGTASLSGPMVGLPGLFPMFNKRANRVITFEERINECFVRSENGHPLSSDGPEMTALIAYIQWLSQGEIVGKPFSGRGLVQLPALTGDPERGAKVYSRQCSMCHGSDGAGRPPLAPPVWGPGAYNDGAGMNTVVKMAAFVQHNMPLTKPASLSAQEAYDVAAYIRTKPHTKFDQQYKKY